MAEKKSALFPSLHYIIIDIIDSFAIFLNELDNNKIKVFTKNKCCPFFPELT